jgi:ubiquitin-protein ligase
MSGLKLNKELFTDVSRLKLLNKKDAPTRFALEKSPFTGQEEDDDYVEDRVEFTVVGLIYPKSDVYNQFAFRIEMKLKNTYPFDPPEVRFLTKIYHPNVDQKGKAKEINTD